MEKKGLNYDIIPLDMAYEWGKEKAKIKIISVTKDKMRLNTANQSQKINAVKCRKREFNQGYEIHIPD
jgi:hypothetical protein